MPEALGCCCCWSSRVQVSFFLGFPCCVCRAVGARGTGWGSAGSGFPDALHTKRWGCWSLQKPKGKNSYSSLVALTVTMCVLLRWSMACVLIMVYTILLFLAVQVVFCHYLAKANIYNQTSGMNVVIIPRWTIFFHTVTSLKPAQMTPVFVKHEPKRIPEDVLCPNRAKCSTICNHLYH